MDKIKVFAFAFLILLFSFRIWQTSGCKHFNSFYFNPLAIKISVESQVNLDGKENRNLSRFFHNKVTAGIFEFSKSYASTFESRYLLEILGPLGLILFVIAAYKVLVSRNFVGTGHLLVVLIASLLSLSSFDPKLIFYLRAVIIFSFTFWGISFLTKGKWLMISYLLLAAVTLCYYLFNWQMMSICNEIFFN